MFGAGPGTQPSAKSVVTLLLLFIRSWESKSLTHSLTHSLGTEHTAETLLARLVSKGMRVINGVAGKPLPRRAPQEGVLLVVVVLSAGSAGMVVGCLLLGNWGFRGPPWTRTPV